MPQERQTSLVPIDTELLERLARRYVLWKPPEEALSQPQRIVAQVMNLGDYDDVQALVHGMGSTCLRQVLTNAEAGQFDARSWTYWHYRLGLSAPGEVPALPERKIP
jgi:hypothetical protein